MFISVVIPAYNSSKYLAETLGSVLDQTLPPGEILVIDDGSTDDTAEIAASFGTPVQVIRRANAGASASRNFGVEQAKGDWVAFIDADDLWEPVKLERQAALISSFPGADVCYTGRVELISFGGAWQKGAVSEATSPENIRSSLFRNTNFLPSSVMVRRSAFLAAGGFDRNLTLAEDWDLWLRLLHAGAVFIGTPDPLTQYRIRTDSLSHNVFALIRAKDEVFDRLVLPHLPEASKRHVAKRQKSEHEACAAYELRSHHDPMCVPTMARSIVRSPFYEPVRYLALLHMFYSTVLKKDNSVQAAPTP